MLNRFYQSLGSFAEFKGSAIVRMEELVSFRLMLLSSGQRS